MGWTGQLTDGEGKVVGSATGKVHFPHIGGEPGGARGQVTGWADTWQGTPWQTWSAAGHGKGVPGIRGMRSAVRCVLLFCSCGCGSLCRPAVHL